MDMLGEGFDIENFVVGTGNEISRFLESGPTSVRRRSRIALALLRAGVATIPQPYDSHHADILMRAAFYSGDTDLYQFVVEYLMSASISVKNYVHNQCGCFGNTVKECFGNTVKEDLVVVALRQFWLYKKDFLLAISNPSESELNCIKNVNFGQTALLREVVQASGLQGLGRELLAAEGRSLPHVKTYLDEAIGDHLCKTVQEWSGPKKDIFTDDFLAFVLFKNDGPLFAEYVTNHGPFSWLQSRSISKFAGIKRSYRLSVTNLVEIAIDQDSCNVLACVPPDAPVLQGGALERAIYGMRAGAVELLLSRNVEQVELAESAVLEFANMTASESWLKVIESLTWHSSKIKFTRPPNSPKRLPIVTRQIVSRSKNEVDFAFRKRAIEIFRTPNFMFLEDADTDLPISYCFLLRRITLQGLLIALPDNSTARSQQVYSCIRFAAKCGDASDVVDLLTVAAANDVDRLVGVEAVLITCYRVDIVAAVLQYALSSTQPERPRSSMAPSNAHEHILTLSCPDRPGIVHAVTGALSARGINILSLQQFADPVSARFFMRIQFGPTPTESTADLAAPFDALAKEFSFAYYDIRPATQKARVLIMVSKIGHCINDLLFRVRSGQLPIDVPVVVSNHPDMEPLVRSYGIEFVHLPVTKETKTDQEQKVLEMVQQHNVELVVLARYMQVLSPVLCEALSGRIINIHHSFLPSFKGAKPYHQAFERGVKIIGATAHFVTADLDEGPIIEQRVTRVDHSMSPQELVDEGSNVESQVLAAAVKWYAERRLFLNGSKTVVFS
ncbi:hypothetical protein HK405_001450 [Cladochytrium tenue]|nr:hypothetical protein HK405_001450 [Cladochytrium tenue]